MGAEVNARLRATCLVLTETENRRYIFFFIKLRYVKFRENVFGSFEVSTCRTVGYTYTAKLMGELPQICREQNDQLITAAQLLAVST
jgi:hypothetical protein